MKGEQHRRPDTPIREERQAIENLFFDPDDVGPSRLDPIDAADLSAKSFSGAVCTPYFVIRQVVGHVGVLTGECIVTDCRIRINANALEQGALASRPAAWC